MNPVVVGLIAGAFTSFASLPQIMYVIKARSMKDISLVTLCMFAFGVSLWLGYGILSHATPVIVWNSISLGLYLAQIAMKIFLFTNRPAIFARRNHGMTLVQH